MASKEKKIREKFQTAIKNPDFVFGLAQELVSEIHGLPVVERKKVRDVYIAIGDVLFLKNASISNHNLKLFDDGIAESESNSKASGKKSAGVVTTEYEEKFRKFVNGVKDEINKFRRVVILRLGKSTATKTKIVLLHDSLSHSPFLKTIKNNLNQECDICEITEFCEAVQRENEYEKFNYIAMITFSPGMYSEKQSMKSMDSFSSIFAKDISKMSINFDSFGVDYDSELVTIREEIAYLIRTDLANRRLGPEREKIIKKLFDKEHCHDIIYEELHSGYSGSRVFEVQPFKETVSTARYVIKINEDKNKLAKEISNFKMLVQGLDPESGYSCEEAITEKYRAIKYNYASVGGVIDSESFSEQLLYADEAKVLTIIENLFGIKLFERWDATKEVANLTLKQWYQDYINVEEIIKKIAIIKDEEEEDVRKSEFISNFDKICQAQVEGFLKVCHGDLHAKNIFVDENEKVFLIDFGDTGKKHALIDYATLECSVKFQHLPKYLDSTMLVDVEKELLDIATFDQGYIFKSNVRSDLKKFLSVINKIRNLSRKYIYDQQTKRDYFMALFLMTFRQIRYDTLNQLYALKSAEILGDKIVKDLGV